MFEFLSTIWWNNESSPSFILSDVLSGGISGDVLTEVCAVLMSDLGRIKRTGMGWEDKSTFLDFYIGKTGK